MAAYRISTAYTRGDVERPDPGGSARFDVQIHQGLPFLAFTRARWELLLAVRNLFHELDDPTASLYDELLVVYARPSASSAASPSSFRAL